MSTGKTYTPSIPDTLMIACGGNMNMAALAARVASFINSDGGDVTTLSLDTICDIYPWSDKAIKSYAKRLQVLGIFVVTFGTHRGTQTEWRKGENFSTFFGHRKGENFSTFNNGERVNFFPIKGENFSAFNNTNKRQINNNYKEIKNKETACGEIISHNDFYNKFHTDDVDEVAARGLGKWEMITNPLPIKYRRVQ